MSCELTWNTFRDHLILEYEIPKWDGDTGRPNVYVPLAESLVEEKLGCSPGTSAASAEKHWFDVEVFRGLMRIRGMECRAPSGYAEAFVARKLSSGSRSADRREGPRHRQRGYIGSVLCPIFEEHGHDVVGLDTGYYDGCDFGAYEAGRRRSRSTSATSGRMTSRDSTRSSTSPRSRTTLSAT